MKSASVVFVTPDNLVGLGLRGKSLESPLTWAAIGGHTEPHESLHQAAHREVWEELGVKIPNRLEYLGNVGENYVFVCRVPDTFQVRLNWENLDFQWKLYFSIPHLSHKKPSQIFVLPDISCP